MRSFSQIIEDGGGYQSIADRMGAPKEQVRFWARRDAIPPEHWRSLSEHGIATLEELAQAAEARRMERTRHSQAAA